MNKISPKRICPGPTKNNDAVAVMHIIVKNKRNLFLPAEKSAIAPKTGEIRAVTIIEIEVPKLQYKSPIGFPSATVFLK